MDQSFQKAAPPVAALHLSTATEVAGTAKELIAKGNVYYEKLDEKEALKYYLPAVKLEPENAWLLVRISREYRHLMSDTAGADEKLQLGWIAVNYAKRAAELGPNDSDAHLAVAISYSKLQPLLSNKEKLETAHIIKSEAEAAIKLNPHSDLAWHVLGRWNMGFAELTGVRRALAEMKYGKQPTATYEDAAKCLRKAIELKPDRLMHSIELGIVYAQMGHAEEARSLIAKGLAMKETEKDDPETKRRGEEELSKLR
jgi:tetratricopeptide (TPR) repeat protein